jgi:hypothetical protein
MKQRLSFANWPEASVRVSLRVLLVRAWMKTTGTVYQ